MLKRTNNGGKWWNKHSVYRFSQLIEFENVCFRIMFVLVEKAKIKRKRKKKLNYFSFSVLSERLDLAENQQ
jgi:predicted membrane chloride channel (bestrophin family)